MLVCMQGARRPMLYLVRNIGRRGAGVWQQRAKCKLAHEGESHPYRAWMVLCG